MPICEGSVEDVDQGAWASRHGAWQARISFVEYLRQVSLDHGMVDSQAPIRDAAMYDRWSTTSPPLNLARSTPLVDTHTHHIYVYYVTCTTGR